MRAAEGALASRLAGGNDTRRALREAGGWYREPSAPHPGERRDPQPRDEVSWPGGHRAPVSSITPYGSRLKAETTPMMRQLW